MKIYFTKSFAKVQLGVGIGKAQYDKRKTHDREIDRALRDRMKRG